MVDVKSGRFRALKICFDGEGSRAVAVRREVGERCERVSGFSAFPGFWFHCWFAELRFCEVNRL